MKPPYQVPSMVEIEAIPWNGFNVVSTFSGCGGSCLGYRMAGYRVLWASEFAPAAQRVYKANHPSSILDCRDIREVAPEEILEAIGLGRGQIDIFDGSPPCDSFSTAGQREKLWGKTKAYGHTKQRSDDLFFEYSRILEGLQPKVFVAENVSGLVKGTAKGYFKQILAALKECGYLVKAKLLDAQWLGVPQARQRVIFVGVRQDLGLQPVFPLPLKYRYSLKEAVPWIVSGRMVTAGNERHTLNGRRPTWDINKMPSPTVTDTPAKISLIDSESDISRYAIGREWDKLRPGEQSKKYFQLVKADPNRPCGTITKRGGCTSAASITHPFERRKFTIPELKRICSFPDDFELTGSFEEQWARLGYSVPPVMMYHISRIIEREVLNASKETSEEDQSKSGPQAKDKGAGEGPPRTPRGQAKV